MTLFRTFILRALRQQRLRSAVTVASLAVGVGVVVAIQLANGASVRGFETALEAIAGRTSLEVTATGAGLDETRLAELDWLREYGLVSPVIDADVALAVTSAAASPGAVGAPTPDTAGIQPVAGPPIDSPAVLETVRLLGVDILRDRPFRDYPLLDGDAVRETTTEAFLDRLTDPRAVILTRTLAERHGVAIGDAVALATGERWAPLHVTGILGADGPAQVLDGNFALMDIAAAQWAVDSLGRLDRVDVRLADGVDVAVAERGIAERLPPGLTVRRPSARGAEVERMLRAFHFNLTALSLIALLVGLFLVYNTVSVSVIARRAEIGTLRTLGATRAAVAALFLGEAAALAAVGCVLGAPLGWLMAHGAVGLTSSTVSQFWIASAAEVPPLEATTVAIAFAVGVPLALAAAAVPALEASRVAPLAAVRGDRDLALRGSLPRRFVVGPVLLFAAGAALALPGPLGGLPVFGMLAALAVVLGAATLMPAVLVGFRRVTGAALARWGRVEGRLAHANLGAAIPRLSISVAALAASLAMMVAIAIMVGSFRETVAYWVGQTLQADLFVAASRRGPTDARAAISDETEALIAAHPSVTAMDGFASVEARYDGIGDFHRGRSLRRRDRTRRTAVQGPGGRAGGHAARRRQGCRRRHRGLLAQARRRTGRPDRAADSARGLPPSTSWRSTTTTRAIAGASSWMRGRSPATSGPAGRPASVSTWCRAPTRRPSATSCGRPSVRSGACSSTPTLRFANRCSASSTRRSRSRTLSRRSPSRCRCSASPRRSSRWPWSGAARSRCSASSAPRAATCGG